MAAQPVQGPPRTLVAWIVEWCTRPGMYLVGWPDHRTLNVSYLFAFITGYEFCLSTMGRDSELSLFNAWLSATRPELGRGSQWFGEVLLQQLGGDHGRTIDEIERMARSYQEEAAVR